MGLNRLDRGIEPCALLLDISRSPSGGLQIGENAQIAERRFCLLGRWGRRRVRNSRIDLAGCLICKRLCLVQEPHVLSFYDCYELRQPLAGSAIGQWTSQGTSAILTMLSDNVRAIDLRTIRGIELNPCNTGRRNTGQVQPGQTQHQHEQTNPPCGPMESRLVALGLCVDSHHCCSTETNIVLDSDLRSLHLACLGLTT